jgi:hypothetical protein
MLVGMDIPGTSAGAWLALGVVLGVLMLGLAVLGAALLFRREGPVDRPDDDVLRDDEPHDDLAGFLEHPPGTARGSQPPAEGWVSLAPSPVPVRIPEPVGVPAPRPLGTRAVLAVMAVAALRLVAAAAAVAAATDRANPTARPAQASAPPTTGRPLERGAVEARLTFGGVVLEPHAVGVTATYPGLRLLGEPGRLRAHVELPTWNCLAAAAPADAAAAGCRRSVTEYADLAEPALEVRETSEGVRIAGRFPTVTRSNGGSSARTGRTYELVVTVVPGDRPENGWLPADAVLRLGDQRTETTGTDAAAGVNVLRYGER